MKWESIKDAFLAEMQRRLENGASGPNMLEFAVQSVAKVSGCDWNGRNADLITRYVATRKPAAVKAMLRVIREALDTRGPGHLSDLRAVAPSTFAGSLGYGRLIIALDADGDWDVRSMTLEEERAHFLQAQARAKAQSLRGKGMTEASLRVARDEVLNILRDTDGTWREIPTLARVAAVLHLLRNGAQAKEVARKMGYETNVGTMLAQVRAAQTKKVFGPLQPSADSDIVKGSLWSLMGEEEFVQDGGPCDYQGNQTMTTSGPAPQISDIRAARHIDASLLLFPKDPSNGIPHDQSVDWLRQYKRPDGEDYDVRKGYLVVTAVPGDETYPTEIWESDSRRGGRIDLLDSPYRLVWKAPPEDAD